MENLLQETALLNYSDPSIEALITSRGWRDLGEKERILAIYKYLRDEIIFGYNESDAMKASLVLKEGYGQCNTKGILLMALLRAVNIPCRTHGFLVDKTMQKGAIKGIYYRLGPGEILHSWVEIFYKGEWLTLEGFILDMEYLRNLQSKFKGREGLFYGYAVATQDFQHPPVEWEENSTYIQKDSIVKDLGIFDSPDELFSAHRQKLNRLKDFVFRHFARHDMNKNLQGIRGR